MIKKTGKIYLEYEHLECDPVSYKIKCSTKNCLTRLNNKLEETFRCNLLSNLTKKKLESLLNDLFF